MRRHDLTPRFVALVVLTVLLALVVVLGVVLAALSTGHRSNGGGLSDPAGSVRPAPDYVEYCAPVGADTSNTCLRITLAAIDDARRAEGLPPMKLPADFGRLTVPEQLFVAVDRERVDRGLVPFAGLSKALDQGAAKGAASAQLPSRPGHSFPVADTEWIGAVDNGLDADFQWVYDDGPDSGVPQCTGSATSGCWADRQIVLDTFDGARHLAMGAGFDAASDSSPEDRGGSSLAATLAVAAGSGDPYAYTWREALAAMSAGTLPPLQAIPSTESDTGIADPRDNINPVPDYTRVCSDNGVDNSAKCIASVLAAINHAHALEGVRPMVLPAGFAGLSVPQQLFVVVNLERVDRGLPPFTGLTTDLDKNAQRGAATADDPPDPGQAYELDDAEWAGGSSNGLDADYGWMYDDGYNSGNLDCKHRGAAGCWGHRKGILDDFGSGPNLVMGAALDPSGDTNYGDIGGTSMAVTMAVAVQPAHAFTYTWAEVLAALPPGSA